jgi:hypothetical protein
MRYIAEKHLADADKIAKQNKKGMSKAEKFAWVYGLGSVALYIFLYMFSAELRELAEFTNRAGLANGEGSKVYFLVPLVIALIFSMVHGAFTGYFWDAVGLKAKQAK